MDSNVLHATHTMFRAVVLSNALGSSIAICAGSHTLAMQGSALTSKARHRQVQAEAARLRRMVIDHVPGPSNARNAQDIERTTSSSGGSSQIPPWLERQSGSRKETKGGKSGCKTAAGGDELSHDATGGANAAGCPCLGLRTVMTAPQSCLPLLDCRVTLIDDMIMYLTVQYISLFQLKVWTSQMGPAA